MAVLKCEVCGSNQLIKSNNAFKCMNCGMQYSLKEIRGVFDAAQAAEKATQRAKDDGCSINNGTAGKG
ncbi:MAG: hypothetical protein K5695_18540 [Oscillospiraceae bacterium]|nr:hypothetical protein [Oscillospiraceae bacterium]